MSGAALQCVYCEDSDDTVHVVATCNAHCNILAHDECFRRRRSSLVWKRRHARECNGAPEYCPHPSCQARLKTRRRTRKADDASVDELSVRMPSMRVSTPPDSQATSDSEGIECDTSRCSFFKKNGRRCGRAVVAGCDACRLHVNEARVKAQMLLRLEEDGLETDRSVQCDLGNPSTTEKEDEDDKDEKIRALQKALLLLQTRLDHKCVEHDAKLEELAERVAALEHPLRSF